MDLAVVIIICAFITIAAYRLGKNQQVLDSKLNQILDHLGIEVEEEEK